MRERTSHRLGLESLKLEGFSVENGDEHKGITISATSTMSSAKCPVCDQCSARAHSRYLRTAFDLPWHGVPVSLQVRARKFFCDNDACQRSIFCERLPEIAARARKTSRLEETLLAIALELGSRAGARLAAELGLLVGRDTLLTRIKSVQLLYAKDVKILGIDDFGFKRGNGASTIMVDLERHEVVDLVQGHSTELIADWLRQRPNLEVVARDRSHVCREGVEAGAPRAVQVADR